MTTLAEECRLEWDAAYRRGCETGAIVLTPKAATGFYLASYGDAAIPNANRVARQFPWWEAVTHILAQVQKEREGTS